MTEPQHRYAVVVAGGSGTRLWPVSRSELPKQMQAFMSEKTLIAETVERLRGIIPDGNVFISTTTNYLEQMQALLPQIPEQNFIVEPAGPDSPGTPAAFALLAQRLHQVDPEAVVFSLASDHAIADINEFHKTVDASMGFVESHPGWITLVGIVPTRADTGLGYVRAGASVQADPPVFRIQGYAEKPSLEVAETYVASGRYFWNAAYYCFRADTLIAAYDDADPQLVARTGDYLRTGEEAAYLSAPRAAHEIEIIDTAKFPLAVVPGDFAWSDIGNWAALHRSLAELAGSDVVHTDTRHVDVGSSRILVLGRQSSAEAAGTGQLTVVTAGLRDVAVVTTADAILVINLAQLEESPQTMSELFEALKQQGLENLL